MGLVPVRGLPRPASRLIGRADEVHELCALLETKRILTLSGAGGEGKTRLALEIATTLANRGESNVWLVELAALADPELLDQHVAAALGVREQPGRPTRAALVDYLQEKRALLVIDNCEHLIERASLLIDDLVRACPELRVLATSREVLAVDGEINWRVPSLALPDPNRWFGVDEVEAGPAVLLFVERARAARLTFVLDAGNAADVARICARLDGIPLGIELAAARVNALTPAQIAARLDNVFNLLSSRTRTALPRHQTLRATIDWSYDLLSEPEREFFARLSVFAGGWTLEAAEELNPGNDQILDLLGWLIDKSLVLAEEQGTSVRYRLLEPIRQYAAEKLAESGQEAATRETHLGWLVRLVDHEALAMRSPQLQDALKRLGRELDNLRAGLAWACRPDGDGELAQRLAGGLYWFWWVRGHALEGRTWVQGALQFPGATPQTHLRALAGLAWLTHQLREPVEARELAQETLRTARLLSDTWHAAWALHLLGREYYYAGDGIRAGVLGAQALDAAREAGDPWLVGWALHLLALAALVQGHFLEARVRFEESLAVRRALGGNEESVCIVLELMGLASYRLGEYARAYREFTASLHLAHEIGFDWTTAHGIAGVALLAAQQGRHADAVRLASSALALSKLVGLLPIPVYEAALGEALEMARDYLDPATFTAALATGTAYTIEQAKTAALAEPCPAEPHDVATGSALPGAVAGMLGPSNTLTAREVEVLRLIAAGLTGKEIAAQLVISLPTVESHTTHIYTKIGARRRADAIAFAVHHGLS